MTKNLPPRHQSLHHPDTKYYQGTSRKKTTTNKAKKLKMTLKDYLKDDNELEHENSIFRDI